MGTGIMVMPLSPPNVNMQSRAIILCLTTNCDTRSLSKCNAARYPSTSSIIISFNFDNERYCIAKRRQDNSAKTTAPKRTPHPTTPKQTPCPTMPRRTPRPTMPRPTLPRTALRPMPRTTASRRMPRTTTRRQTAHPTTPRQTSRQTMPWQTPCTSMLKRMHHGQLGLSQY